MCSEPTAGGGADDTGLGVETTNKIDCIYNSHLNGFSMLGSFT